MNEINLYEFIETQDYNHKIELYVTKIKCISCVNKIESELIKYSYVKYVRVNMTSSKLTIHWQGDINKVYELKQKVEDLGFVAQAYNHDDYVNHKNDEKSQLLKRIAVSGFCLFNLMLFSIILWISDQDTLGESVTSLFHWISALISLPAIIYCGSIFIKSAIKSIINMRSNIDIPISVAIIMTSIMSIIQSYKGEYNIYFDSVLMLIFFLLIGKYCNLNAILKSKESADQLLKLTANRQVKLFHNNNIENINIDDIKVGDIILISAGEIIPVDSIITEGETEIDMSNINGESINKYCRENEKI